MDLESSGRNSPMIQVEQGPPAIGWHHCMKKVKLNNRDCLPILMLLNIMQYIVLAYLMLFTALSNAVCLYNAFFFCY